MRPVYDRQLLLLGPKRNEVLELWEVQQFATDVFGRPNYLAVYGMQPDEWYARGVRLLGRTAIECTPDQVAAEIGRDVADTVDKLTLARRTRSIFVIDPFAGSANTLYWILRHIPGAHGIGFELDPQVYELTRRNLSILGVPIEIQLGDYLHAVRELKLPEDALVVAFIAPPWGEAFTPSEGLDVSRTEPPVRDIVDSMDLPNPMLFAVQVVEHMVPGSLKELTARFEWSVLHIYDSSKSGQNRNGLVLAARRWSPAGYLDTVHRSRIN